MKTRQATSTINGRDGLIQVCVYCEADVLAARVPEGQTNESWHGTAKCVEGPEPSRKMGGPA